MANDHDSKRSAKKPARPEFEVAYFTKELGRPLQRKMLDKQLAGLSSEPRASHHDDAVPQADGSPPPEDRAG